MPEARSLALALLVACASVSCGRVTAAEREFDPSVDLDRVQAANGERHFRTHCARCHGMRGEGGEGTNLNQPHLRHAVDNAALWETVVNGIPGTGMPGTMLEELETYEVMAHVRALGRIPAEPPPGDPARGQALYWGQAGCPACHIVAGRGAGIGPELTDVGARRGVGHLTRALAAPAADLPRGGVPMPAPYINFLTVRLTDHRGATLEGMRVNEDAFTVQVRDASGAISSHRKADLLSYEKVFAHSLMPEYDGALGERAIADLVSYLMTLRGSP